MAAMLADAGATVLVTLDALCRCGRGAPPLKTDEAHHRYVAAIKSMPNRHWRCRTPPH